MTPNQIFENPRFHELMAVVNRMGKDFKVNLNDANCLILIHYFDATVNALIASENEGRPRDQQIDYEEIYNAKKIALEKNFKPDVQFNDLPPIEEIDSTSPAHALYDKSLRLLYPNGHPEFFNWDNLPEDIA